MELVSSEQCTGCGACTASCPEHAIGFTADNDGFPVPIIRKDQCIECGLCNRACPVMHPPETSPVRKAYAAQIRDRDALLDSTSGGLFTAFSREVFRRGGIVFGCAWDQEYNAVIRRAENEEELKPMRGSKYVWSRAAESFPEIEKELKDGRTVLFSGLPCQAAGLKKFLHKKYERLYLMTFFCGGAPSPLAFRQYLKTLTKDINLSELDFKFRDKAKYGVGIHISYNSATGRIHQGFLDNPYFMAYYLKVFHRFCCYRCRFRYKDRTEDITIGDFWGVNNYHNEFDIKAGVSALLVNTDQGAELFDHVKDHLILSETTVENIARANNMSLTNEQKVFRVPEYRKAAFQILRDKGWAAAEKKYLNDRTRLMIRVKSKIPDGYKKLFRKLIGK